ESPILRQNLARLCPSVTVVLRRAGTIVTTGHNDRHSFGTLYCLLSEIIELLSRPRMPEEDAETRQSRSAPHRNRRGGVADHCPGWIRRGNDAADRGRSGIR